MKKIALIVAVVLSGLSIQAQQDPLFTQYLDNQIYVNPAFAGAKNHMNITALHRQQWAGFTGAPMVTSLSFHTPLRYRSVGIGVDLMNDRLGPVNRLNANVDFSYKLHFKKNRKLSFGVKAGIDSYSSTFGDIDHTGSDALAQELTGAYSPVFGAGVYYLAPKWFIGASAPRITSNLSQKVGGLDSALQVFGIVGGVLDLNDSWTLRPTVQSRYMSGVPLSLDMTVAGIWQDRFYVGASYRLLESASAFVQYRLTDQFKIGYAYDFPMTELRTATSGSHEVLLSFSFIKRHNNLVSPRYFN